MSLAKLFHSKRLLQLYEEGKLDSVLRLFKKDITEENFIGGGGDASGFLYKEGKQILKLCMKQIGYFKRYGQGGTNEAQQFQEHINSLSEYFVPVEKILYEDENVFVYTQNRCQLMKKERISPRIVIGVFQMVQFMLLKNILVTDLSPHNLGLLNGRVVIFDYHGLHPLRRNDGRIKRRKWWVRLMRNLTRYLSYIYAPEKLNEYSALMDDYDDSVVEKLKFDRLLPSTYIELLLYVSINDTEVSVDILFKLLQNCIMSILQTFHFHPKQLNHMRCLCSL